MIFLKFPQRNLSCIRTLSGRDDSIVRTVAHPPQVISISGFARPDHGAGASGRLNFNMQFPYTMSVRLDHEGRRLDGWSQIGSYHIRCTSIRTKAVRRSAGQFWTTFLPYGDTRLDGKLPCPDGWLIFPFLELGKYQGTVRELIGVRTCCWNVRTVASCTKPSRYSGEVLTERARHPDGWFWTVWCPNGMTRRPDGWSSRQKGVRTGWHIVWTADRELEFLLILTSLWKWNPCLQHLYT